MNRIYFFLVFIALLFSGKVYGQQPPVNSLYMFDQLLINPAYAGAQVQFSATAVHRNQWVNFPGAPKTSSFTMQSSLVNNTVGVGLVFINDRIGVHTDNLLFGAFSYKLPMPVGTLNMGISVGGQFIRSDWSKLTRKQDDNTLEGFTSSNKVNFGTGLFYSNRQFYFGASVPYLLNSTTTQYDSIVASGTLSEGSRRRVYWLTTGSKFKLSRQFDINPQLLVRIQEGSPVTFDLNLHLIYLEAVGFGATYRLTEGIIGMFELKLNENLHVGYAYDMTASPLQRYSNGTHEIMVNYRYKIPSLHKGLECPTYF